MRFTHWARLALLLALLGGVLGACGSDASDEGSDGGGAAESQSDEPAKMLAIAAMTGTASAYGHAFTQGAQAGVDAVNADGGILGRQIELTILDDGTDPSKAVTALQKHLQDERPDMIYPGTISAETVALMPLVAREKIMAFTASFADVLNDQDKFPYLFSIATPVARQSEIYAGYLVEKGYKTAGMLVASDASGETVSSLGKEALENAGIKVVSIQQFNQADTDMTGPLQKLKAANPDVLIIGANTAPAGYIIRDVQKLGIKTPILGDIQTANTNFDTLVKGTDLSQVGLFSYGIMTRGEGSPDERPEVSRAKEFILKRAKKIEQGMALYSFGYDLVQVWAKGAEQAGSLDPAKITEKLEQWSETPPEGGQWMTYETFPYTPDNHFASGAPKDFAIGEAGTLESGTREIKETLGD